MIVDYYYIIIIATSMHNYIPILYTVYRKDVSEDLPENIYPIRGLIKGSNLFISILKKVLDPSSSI
jgi:hypothetical protein